MARMYRFTHNAVDIVQEDNVSIPDTVVPAEVTLANLTMFSTILFVMEFRKAGLGDTVDISTTCNMSEWLRRIYHGARSTPDVENEDGDIDIMTLPPRPTSQAGLVYATTSKAERQPDSKESYSSFLFAIHKSVLAKTIPSASGTSDELSPEAQALVATNGITHIWLCGSDPEQRRHRLMTRCLSQLEKDVLEWKASGQGSGVITVHTIPQVFPGMVQFLLKNGFKGGDRLAANSEGKVLYWKEL
ncbi:hypothetical protein BGX21_003286 [Mortierella sp. AD011]|nr:hypothetical protein BGX20_003215 [Mortierella sp. AD010]KAF9377076.1 hypothetical protein BGX21_003286 [Mortierella sp. AD011]